MTAPTIPMRTLLDALAALSLDEAELLPVATSKAWHSGRYTYQRDVGCLCPTCCAKRMQAIDKSYKWY